MRKQLFLIIWVVTLSTIKLYAQDNPIESKVINATKSIIAKDFKPNELHDYVRVDNEPITFINGNFSGIKRKECIAICPMNRLTATAGSYQKFIILFCKNEAGNWTKGSFHVLEQEIETKDLNNDKLPELICKSGYSWQGEDGSSTTIYQLRGDSIKKIYSNKSVPSQVETSWEKVACPFDSSRALLPVTCGRLMVPENYDDPKGRSIEIAFMVVKAQKKIDPENPVLFLNGGPGQASLYFAETLVTNPLIHDVVVDRDWVFFDQRGTGRSIPQLYCPDEQDNPFDLKKCRDDLINQGIDLSQYNSARIASDMEALRKALGVNQWNLWGISYGSRLAFTMARYYPSSVRSIVHDGPDLPEGQELIDDARGLDVALNKLFSKCAADTACSSKFPQLRSRFIAALLRLRQQPLSVGEQTFDDVMVIRFIRNWLYPRGYSTYEQRIQNLLIFMDAAARGDGQLMVDTQQSMRKEEGLDKVRPPEPIYARLSIGQNLSVYCNEKKPFESECEYRQAVANSEIVRSFLQGFGDPSDCALWPAGQAKQIANTRVYYDGPQLVFTGELDASSSGLAGYKIEMLYANAINVVFRNGMHGQFPTELPNSEDRDYWMCALRLGHQFFADPQRKLDTGCAEIRQLRLVR